MNMAGLRVPVRQPRPAVPATRRFLKRILHFVLAAFQNTTLLLMFANVPRTAGVILIHPATALDDYLAYQARELKQKI